jgi:hypothetical protein
MAQIAEVFTKKKADLGAKKAAKDLNVCLASFYNYANGKDLPRMEVLETAQKIWRIKWSLLDPSGILRTRKIVSGEQLLLPFLQSVREEDVEIAMIRPKKQNVLQVVLKIRFPA